jgi:hypothetical protein
MFGSQFTGSMEDLTWKTTENPTQTPEEKEEDPNKFPVIVFSHGISGNRFIYSTISASIGSYGYVVIVIEHRYLAFFHFKRPNNLFLIRFFNKNSIFLRFLNKKATLSNFLNKN